MNKQDINESVDFIRNHLPKDDEIIESVEQVKSYSKYGNYTVLGGTHIVLGLILGFAISAIVFTPLIINVCN